jgi:hypothetical protein
MKLITTRQELIESLKDVLAVETTARKNYESDIASFKNFEITNTISKIKMDEDTHINILNALIKMLEKR